jgi:archaetidylinositol phosphate synthase
LRSSEALARSWKPRVVDEFLAERVYRPLAHVVVLALRPLRVPPPAVVLVSAASGIAGAVVLARGNLIVAALLVQVKTVLDNADGQLARLTGRVTVLGRYLDSECDLLVDAALFAALGWYANAPVVGALGFLLLTAILSVNFNLERLARAADPRPDPPSRGVTRALERAYAALYGWQDRLVEAFVERRLRGASATARRAYHDRATLAVLANLGMSTQLACFGLALTLGRPLLAVWLLVAQAAVVGLFVVRREGLIRPDSEVSLEHR